MRSFVEIFLALRNLVEIDVRRRQHLLDLDAGDLLQRQRISVGVNRAAHQQIAADFAAGRIGQRLVDAQLVQPCAAFQMEIVQQVDDDIAGRGDEILVPGLRRCC